MIKFIACLYIDKQSRISDILLFPSTLVPYDWRLDNIVIYIIFHIFTIFSKYSVLRKGDHVEFFLYPILTKYLEPPTPGQKCGHISWKGGVSSSAHLSEIALQNINSGRDIHGPFSKNWVLTQVRETSYWMLICFIYLSNKLWQGFS